LAYTDTKAEVATVKVPTVEGMTAAAANRVLIDAGLNIRIRGNKNYLSGSDKITYQSVMKDSIVPVGTVVEIFFGELEDYDKGWDSGLPQ
jgi:beta-lactam-binding protein with PASTA domain